MVNRQVGSSVQRYGALFCGVAVVTALVTGCSLSEGGSSELTEVFFVAETAQGFRLFSELHSTESSGEDQAFDVISALISGEIQPRDPDYVNLWGATHDLRGITYTGDTATIDIDLGQLNVGGESEQRAIDQLVWTLTGINPDVTAVALEVDGRQVETLAGHVDTTKMFSRLPSYEVLSPVQIVAPYDGEELTGPVVVSGEACTFEATLSWSLLRAESVVSEGFTSAERGCPERSPWSVELGELEAGPYQFVAWESSANDGTIIAEDSKSFIVR
jgi:hypothetical protein